MHSIKFRTADLSPVEQSRHFFTMRTLNDNKTYTDNDEWVVKMDDYTHKVGISNLYEQLGDLVYIEYCLEQAMSSKRDDIVIIESVKASNSIKAPLDGKLVENNSDLEDSPEKVSDMPKMIILHGFVRLIL